MSTELETIKDIAKASLMADFFAARVDEEGLWSRLRLLLSGVQPTAPSTTIGKIQRLAVESATAADFIEKIKAVKLWHELKELVLRIQVA